MVLTGVVLAGQVPAVKYTWFVRTVFLYAGNKLSNWCRRTFTSLAHRTTSTSVTDDRNADCNAGGRTPWRFCNHADAADFYGPSITVAFSPSHVCQQYPICLRSGSAIPYRYFVELTLWEFLRSWQFLNCSLIPARYGIPRFITAFTRARHLSLSWASPRLPSCDLIYFNNIAICA